MKLVEKVVGVSIGLFVAAVIMPVALTELANATLTSVDPAVVTVIQVLLPILGVISVAIAFLRSD